MNILCTHNDGGVGKTSLAIHVIGALQTTVSKILGIDCDDQADLFQFFVRREPSKNKELVSQQSIDVVFNKNRESIKRVARLDQYEHIVVDMDSPLKNTVQIIVDSPLDKVLIPVNRSQKHKALRNLHRTLEVIAQLDSKARVSLETIVVPLGVEPQSIEDTLSKTNRKPGRLQIGEPMPNLEDLMQVSIYEDCRYIWEYENQKSLQSYFCRLIGLE
ncbi:MAG: ParA family protein [Spirulinaceae cyanobacterium SM2_1_0]|nr:ParA family protein [Spirulinaceae cyanobacterium SM2_1_0]